MGSIKAPKYQLWCAIVFLISIQARIHCRTYKVGDLHGWGIPMAANPQVYTKWSDHHNLTVGDSLFFLYPPSQDSVIQVTKGAYDACDVKDPIVKMKDGNSVFNITHAGNFYFTSGVEGHCGKSQKLHVLVSGNGSYDDAPVISPASAPSYVPAFGSIPVQGANSTSSDSAPVLGNPVLVSAAAAVFMSMLVM